LATLAAVVWTHAAYPAAAALLARVRKRVVRKGTYEPAVAVIVAAHNEEPVIVRRVETLRALDYPPENEIVVTSDASTDRIEELAAEAGARVVTNPRGGKVAAQDHAVRETESEIVGFMDANATWAPDALRKLVRSFSPTPTSPTSAASCSCRRPTEATRRASTGATRC
jgi:cellulose synthase/poly-beta-1,6-N-acetylglucosamine synthase-like glycosyltransferase